MCDHLQPLEAELIQRGIPETYRGQAWSDLCREWAYFNCFLDLAALRQRLHLPDCVEDHANEDPRSGTERGFFCREHWDGIMGHLQPSPRYPTVP